MTLGRFTADLHIHTCLSPCGDLEMAPTRIVEAALLRKLDIIAITDHNSAENVGPVIQAAAGSPLTVLAGMEIATREEVHVISLFPTYERAADMQKKIYETLEKTGDQSMIDEQVIATEFDEVEGFCPYLLVGATPFGVRNLVDTVHEMGGLAIAAHIDRQSFGIIGQLGFIPPRVAFDGLEVSRHLPLAEAHVRFPEYNRFPFVTSSDAHYLKDIGSVRTEFRLEAPDFHELHRAFRGENGRGISDTTS